MIEQAELNRAFLQNIVISQAELSFLEGMASWAKPSGVFFAQKLEPKLILAELSFG